MYLCSRVKNTQSFLWNAYFKIFLKFKKKNYIFRAVHKLPPSRSILLVLEAPLHFGFGFLVLSSTPGSRGLIRDYRKSSQFDYQSQTRTFFKFLVVEGALKEKLAISGQKKNDFSYMLYYQQLKKNLSDFCQRIILSSTTICNYEWIRSLSVCISLTWRW